VSAFLCDIDIFQLILFATTLPHTPSLTHPPPPHTHSKQACGRICRALKKEFVPYLPALVPALLHAARAKTDMKVCSYVSYCVCMDVCVYVCVTLVPVLLHAARVKTDLKVYVFLFVFVCMYAYVFVCMRVCIYIHSRTWHISDGYETVCVSTSLFVYVCIYTYVFV